METKTLILNLVQGLKLAFSTSFTSSSETRFSFVGFILPRMSSIRSRHFENSVPQRTGALLSCLPGSCFHFPFFLALCSVTSRLHVKLFKIATVRIVDGILCGDYHPAHHTKCPLQTLSVKECEQTSGIDQKGFNVPQEVATTVCCFRAFTAILLICSVLYSIRELLE